MSANANSTKCGNCLSSFVSPSDDDTRIACVSNKQSTAANKRYVQNICLSSNHYHYQIIDALMIAVVMEHVPSLI